MAATKFYASWKKANETGIVINAFEALRLRSMAEITTDRKEESVLFDIDTGLNVYPVKGKKIGERLGQPHFSYYPKEESPLKNQTSSFELSSELIIFLQAFEKIKKFRIQDWNKKSVEISVAQYSKLHRIKVRESYVIVKFYFNLKETKPYSYFYKFNGVLALEFTVTSKPRPIKRVGLAEVGIPLYVARAIIPKWTREKYGEEFESEKQLELVVSDITRTFNKSNYLLFGAFREDAITLPEFQEEYGKMSDFERQCDEMRVQIQRLKKECESYEDKLKHIKADILAMEKLLREKANLLKKYEDRIAHFEKMKEDSALLKEENSLLKADNLRIEREKSGLETMIKSMDAKSKSMDAKSKSMEEEIERLKNRSLLQRILNR